MENAQKKIVIFTSGFGKEYQWQKHFRIFNFEFISLQRIQLYNYVYYIRICINKYTKTSESETYLNVILPLWQYHVAGFTYYFPYLLHNSVIRYLIPTQLPLSGVVFYGPCSNVHRSSGLYSIQSPADVRKNHEYIDIASSV